MWPVPRPRTTSLSLDFASRCAVAGLQLGRSKVFLRREAFDRIEGLRSEKFFQAASTIQKIVRGKICRDYFQEMRNAAIVAQCFFRLKIAQWRVDELRVQRAAVRIQCAWRLFVSRMYVFEIQLACRTAAVIIQRAWREYKYRESNPMSPAGPSEDEVLNAVISVQAMCRGGKTRDDLISKSPMSTPEP